MLAWLYWPVGACYWLLAWILWLLGFFLWLATPLLIVFVNDLLDFGAPFLIDSLANTFVSNTLRIHFYWGAICIENAVAKGAVILPPIVDVLAKSCCFV
jgi:hypothetical protein